jgi:hypothetical protein
MTNTGDLLPLLGGKRPKRAHIFAKAEDLFYLEPHWCSTRLFEAEKFTHPVTDPFCGTGRVAEAARLAGYSVWATDIVDRSYEHFNGVEDFLTINRLDDDESVVGNPPFDDRILQHAIKLNPIKMALIWPLARVVAAHSWLSEVPLARVLMMTPRPAMPPGAYIAEGKKPEGARVEHAWLIFERGYRGSPQMGWLHRDFGLVGLRSSANLHQETAA